MFRMVTRRIKKLLAWALAIAAVGVFAAGVYALIWLL